MILAQRKEEDVIAKDFEMVAEMLPVVDVMKTIATISVTVS